MEKALKAPAPNHVHGRVTDVNRRLRDVCKQFSIVLDRLRCSGDGIEGLEKARVISHSVQDKLNDTSDLVHELEVLANEYEQYIGTAEEDVPMKTAGRAINQ